MQNHSWGSLTSAQLDATALEKQAIKRAIEQGRDGKGVVMIRVTGNNRAQDWSAADDGYSNDPRVLTVADVGPTGRVQSFSNMGACVLCAGLIGRGVYSTDQWVPLAGIVTPATTIPRWVAITHLSTLAIRIPCRRLRVWLH